MEDVLVDFITFSSTRVTYLYLSFMINSHVEMKFKLIECE